MKQSLQYFLYYWFPVGLYALLIFFLSSGPAPEGGPEFFQADKVAHFLIFAGLGALCLRTLNTTALGNKVMAVLLLSIVLSSGYGISDEIHQYFVPSRNSDILDALADICGSIAGVLAYWRIFIFRRRVEGQEPESTLVP